MSNTFEKIRSKTFSKLFKASSSKNDSQANEVDSPMSIGNPTDFKKNFHVEVAEDGSLTGLPPNLMILAKQMKLSAEEAKSKEANEQVKNALLFFNKNQEKMKHGDGVDFIRMHSGSSGDSGGTKIENY